MSSPTPPLAVDLQPSRLFAGSLLALGAVAGPAAQLSHLPLPLKLALLAVLLAGLRQAWRAELRAGLRRLCLVEPRDGERRIELLFADGRELAAPAAGHAWLGTLAIFVFVERAGWRRCLGPQRLCILHDAVSADDFRRLRARLLLS
ncbi:MAG: hypothetical protein ACOY33_10110 [Pseudomonadota bacterium]